MAKVIMIQGTMSGAGKSFLVAGLCRIMKQDGYRVAPFKSQNMALNSFITEEGLEMGAFSEYQAEGLLMMLNDDQSSFIGFSKIFWTLGGTLARLPKLLSAI